MTDLTDGTFSIIPLETTDECRISKIEKIEIKDNRIYIMDRTACAVYVFDMEGKYLNKIHGQGAEEYTELSYMTVTDSSVIILDHPAKKQIEYSIPSLEFIEAKDISENFEITDIFYLNGTFYYINDSDNPDRGQFRLFSQKHGTNNFEKYLPSEKPALNLSINGPTYAVNGNEASLIYSGCDTIFRLRDGKVFPEYAVKFKDKKVEYSSEKTANVFEDSPPGRVIGVNRINESDKYLFVEISMTVKRDAPAGPGNYRNYICIHDKSDHSTVICPDNIIYNSTFDDVYGIGKIIDNKIVFWCDAHILPFIYPPKLAERIFKKKEYGGRLKNVIENLTEDGNPVFFIYGLK
jgi:hypothetical protein